MSQNMDHFAPTAYSDKMSQNMDHFALRWKNVTKYGPLRLKVTIVLHGDTVCAKVKWMFSAIGLGPELRIMKLNHENNNEPYIPTA